MVYSNSQDLIEKLNKINSDYFCLLDEYEKIMPYYFSDPTGTSIQNKSVCGIQLSGNNKSKYEIIYKKIYKQLGEFYSLSEIIKNRKSDNTMLFSEFYNNLKKIQQEKNIYKTFLQNNDNISDAAIQSIKDIKFNYNFYMLNSILLFLFVFISAFSLIRKSRQTNYL